MVTIEELARPARLKIQRANHHINDLNGKIDSFLERRPFRLIERYDRHVREITYFIKKHEPIPEQFSLIVGDAIHNLRAALDMTMFAMIGDKATSPQQVQFPFAWKQESLVSTMKQRQVHLAGDKVVTEVNGLEPYLGSGSWVETLHLLDIADKHKLILTVAAAGSLSARSFSMFPPDSGHPDTVFHIHYETVFCERNVPLSKLREATDNRLQRVIEKEANVQPTFGICLFEGDPPEISYAIPTLKNLSDCVGHAVGRMLLAHMAG